MWSKDDIAALLARNNLQLHTFQAGQGGSAFVHRATLLTEDAGIGPAGLDVAVKEYKDEVVAKPEQIQRIKQEGTLSALRHPNVVRVFSLLYPGDDMAPLLIMDWLHGLPLDSWCREHTRPWEELRRVAVSLVDGVSALHSQKIMHRDIKPANVMVTNAGEPILMDMGVIEIATDDEHTMGTSVRDFVGTVRYAAPQFIRGEPFDFADDIYSLGATLYFLVTGAEVFAKVQRKPLLAYYILTERPRVNELGSAIPSQLSVLLEGALHPDRKRRPTVKEMGDVLQTPDIASYIQRELDARNNEERGYAVIKVLDDGATVLVDLRNTEPRQTTYAVVRQLSPVKVPSLGGEARPEKWIAEVVFKHSHNGIGHFAVQGKRWRDGTPSPLQMVVATDFGKGTSGGWVEYEKHSEVVRVGDVVVAQG